MAERTLILLHGASFSSAIWAKVGTLKRLDDQGVSYVAPDLPGFGETPRSRLYSRYQGMVSFLNDLCATVGIKRVVIAGASMGGGIALSFAKERPQMIDGLFLIGSVGLNWPGIREFLKLLNKPVELVWGMQDTVVPLSTAESITSTVKNAHLTVMQGGHPVYLHDTERFNNLLCEWMNSNGFAGRSEIGNI
jgi:pimeloyl-ACP methyl ester carboxylesterase